jgi:hypothetical protein
VPGPLLRIEEIWESLSVSSMLKSSQTQVLEWIPSVLNATRGAAQQSAKNDVEATMQVERALMKERWLTQDAGLPSQISNLDTCLCTSDLDTCSLNIPRQCYNIITCHMTCHTQCQPESQMASFVEGSFIWICSRPATLLARTKACRCSGQLQRHSLNQQSMLFVVATRQQQRWRIIGIDNKHGDI